LGRSINGHADIFVDDIVLSGPPFVGRLESTVKKIITQEGFHFNPSKTGEAPVTKEQILTGIRVNQNFDVPSEKIRDAQELLKQLRERVDGGERIPEREIRSIDGKIRYIRSLNPGAGKHLFRRLRKILKAA